MSEIKINKLVYPASDGNTYVVDFNSLSQSGGGSSDMPTAGTPGFGTGVYPGDEEKLSSEMFLTGMDGYDDPNSDNYGNYQHINGSIYVWIPKFYYTFELDGEEDIQNAMTYSGLTHEQIEQIKERSPLNAFVIAPRTAFTDEADANSHKFILHRAFIDGGEEKSGFFIMKYVASRGTDGTSNVALSVKNGKPISLTSNDSFTNSTGMAAGCTGILKDSITLSKNQGSNYNCASVFMYSALALLSKFLGTVATSTDYCAWYDPDLTTNFPKGCNFFLKDCNDSSVTFTTCGDSGDSNKPLAGSGSPFAKTTHNGQNCGVTDLNGTMWEMATGLRYVSEYHIMKTSAKLTDFTIDNVDGATATYSDLWETLDDIYAKGVHYWGNASATSLRSSYSGQDRDLNGVWSASNGTGGTSEFGNDYCIVDSSTGVSCGGYWGNGSNAGVFSRNSDYWADTYSDDGFRAAGYLD